MERATFAAKFCTTSLVMLWQSGVSCPSFLTIAGTESRSCCTSLGLFPGLVRVAKAGGVRIRVRSSAAACLGSWAPTMALITATPSRALKAAFVWYKTRCMFVELMPPIATVAIFASRAVRALRILRVPAVPMIDFVFTLLK